MEKKLKVNFILKGIAVFAFVAFCLLAILAGVTLPFVSNASTVDSAVASAESDCATASSENLDNFVPLSNAVIGTTYYGIYIPDIEKNWTATADDSPYSLRLFNFHTLDTNSNFRVFSYKQRTVRSFTVKMVVDGMNRDVQTICETSTFENQYIYDNGFVLDEITSASSVFDIYVRTSPYIGDVSSYITQIETLTAEKNALETQVNNLTDENNNLKKSLGFKSRFGYIGDLKNNQMYLNLRSAPIIPDDIYCPYRNDTLVNYYKKGNDYYLSIVDAYDSNNNVVTDSFSGWKFINKKNPDGTPSRFYDFEFFIRDLRIAHIDTVEFVNNCFSTPNYNNIYYLVSTDFLDANYAAYGSDKSQYFYSLKSYLNKDDVRDFFALFDLTYYIPVNDAFYLDGYNNASKGYFDDGYKQGYDVGNTDGYNNGFSAGDSKGYQRGLNDANNYTFLSLFGAIFDAPIQALFGGTQRLPAGTKITDSSGKTITLTSDTVVNRGGMLNFELMGVNLSGFVLALFSLSIIIVVIKFALAKK